MNPPAAPRPARHRPWLSMRAFLVAGLLTLLGLVVAEVLRQAPLEEVERYRPLAERWGQEYDIDPDLVLAVVLVESGGDPQARSPRQARGLMQLMPTTAREVATWLRLEHYREEHLDDPEISVRLGTRYLAWLAEHFGEAHPRTILAAYNAGYGTVQGWLREARRRHGSTVSDEALLAQVTYPETREYVRRVLAAWRRLRAVSCRGE